MEKKKKVFYGYPLIFILGIVLFFSGSSMMPIASIVNPMMLQDSSLGLTGATLGVGFSLLALMQGLPAPLIGQLVARRGARLCIAIGGVIMIVGALCMIFVVKSPLTYFLSFGILVALGGSVAGAMAAQSTIGNWFKRRRGLAMATMLSIGSCASIVLPLVVNAVVNASGGAWQSGWVMFLCFGVIIIPIGLIFVKNKPADVGQEPDGIDSSEQEVEKKQKPTRVYHRKEEMTFKQALKTPWFWMISLAAAGAFCGYSLCATQGVIHFTALGFTMPQIVGAVSALGAASLIGRFVIGAISDIIEPIRLMAVCLIVIAVAIFLASATHDIVMVYVFYVLVGFAFGSISANMATSLANFFGLAAYAKALGILMICQTVISSMVPILSGSIFDATGFCTMAFYIVGGFVVICALSAFLVRIPKKVKENS